MEKVNKKYIHYEDLAISDPYAYRLLHKAFELNGFDVKVGDRVVLTEWGKQGGICKRSNEGVVKGFSRKGMIVRVRPVGLKTTYSYWAGFWRRKKHPLAEQF